MIKSGLLVIMHVIIGCSTIVAMDQKATLSKSKSVDNIARFFDGFSVLKSSGSQSLKRLSSHNVFEHFAKLRPSTPRGKASGIVLARDYSCPTILELPSKDMEYLKKVVNNVKHEMYRAKCKIDNNLLCEWIEKKTNSIIAQTVREHIDFFMVESFNDLTISLQD